MIIDIGIYFQFKPNNIPNSLIYLAHLYTKTQLALAQPNSSSEASRAITMLASVKLKETEGHKIMKIIKGALVCGNDFQKCSLSPSLLFFPRC